MISSSIFFFSSCYFLFSFILNCPTAVDCVCLPSGKAAGITREIQSQLCNLGRGSDAAHGLTRNKITKCFFVFSRCAEPVMQARAVNCARANRVTAHTLGDKISCNCLSHSDDRGLGRTIDEPVRNTLQRGCDRRHVDD